MFVTERLEFPYIYHTYSVLLCHRDRPHPSYWSSPTLPYDPCLTHPGTLGHLETFKLGLDRVLRHLIWLRLSLLRAGSWARWPSWASSNLTCFRIPCNACTRLAATGELLAPLCIWGNSSSCLSVPGKNGIPFIKIQSPIFLWKLDSSWSTHHLV